MPTEHTKAVAGMTTAELVQLLSKLGEDELDKVKTMVWSFEQARCLQERYSFTVEELRELVQIEHDRILEDASEANDIFKVVLNKLEAEPTNKGISFYEKTYRLTLTAYMQGFSVGLYKYNEWLKDAEKERGVLINE